MADKLSEAIGAAPTNPQLAPAKSQKTLQKGQTGQVSGGGARAAQQDFTERLTENIDLTKIKMRYHKNEVQFNAEDMKLFEEENDDQIFSSKVITNVLDADENRREFEEEKLEAYKEEIAPAEKTMKGWGAWTGFGVKEPQVDKEKERRELEAKIVF